MAKLLIDDPLIRVTRSAKSSSETVLGGLAERELIRARTGEGRGSAETSSDRYADAHVACGGLHAAPRAASSQPSGPQHLTPLGSWAELRGLMRLVLEGKTPFGGRSFPI